MVIASANNNDDVSLVTLIKGRFMSVPVPHNHDQLGLHTENASGVLFCLRVYKSVLVSLLDYGGCTTGGLEKATIPLYAVSNQNQEVAAVAAQVLVDTKVNEHVLANALSL